MTTMGEREKKNPNVEQKCRKIKVQQIVAIKVLFSDQYCGRRLTMLPRPESVMSNITVRGIPGSFLA